MKLELEFGEYCVFWEVEPMTYLKALDWIHETIGDGWGDSVKSIDFRNTSAYVFKFKRLYHAQWFMLRWGNV